LNNIIILGAWCLWLQRNRVAFDGKSPSIQKVLQGFLDECFREKKKFSGRVSLLGFGWSQAAGQPGLTGSFRVARSSFFLRYVIGVLARPSWDFLVKLFISLL
jgi:hypothetical protein